MSARRILLIGGTGFHGSAIRTAMEKQGSPTTLLVRDPGKVHQGFDTRVITGDLTDPRSLGVALKGIDTVIHAGGYVGYDETLCHEVNVEGTANLVGAAASVGVRNLLYVSTTAVYGSGTHRGVAVGEISPAPSSILSRSRLEAESLVLGVGGTVVRPSLVYGVGDRWVIPSITQITRRLGGEVDEGRPLLSFIRVDDLARLIVYLAGTDLSQEPGRIWHASNREPTAVGAVLRLLRSSLVQDLPTQSMTRRAAILKARAIDLPVERVDLLGNDRWYDSHEIWDAAGLRSPAGVSLGAPEASWYRAFGV